MASIIKNQIIKHLSQFARNITPDQISLEVLSGRGELRNIELNEKVLTEKLELPPWLKICKAICNKVTVKVPWTRIKKAAVEIYVDEITVTVRLLASAPTDLRKAANTFNAKSYDLAERVVEGLSLYVMTVDVQFESDSFGGSLMFSRLSVESKTPQWKDEKNINFTRVHDKQIKQVLFFKQVSWQLLRVEASAHTKNSFGEQVPGRRNAINSPLRLITGDGKCRIAIKKDDTTCAVIDGRIEVILEDILWVATLVQVRSAVDFYKHILDLANAVQNQTENNPFLIDNQQKPKPALQVPSRGTTAEIEVSKAFKQFDIHQSSHHLYIGKIDLHLFDDSASEVLPENWNTDNGAIQATLYKLRVDFYPCHQVFSDGQFSERLQWVRYHSPNSCTELATKQLEQHLKVLSSKLESGRRDRFLRLWPQLSSQNVVMRVEDVVVQCVSEQTTKKESLLNMFVQDKQAKNSLPQNVSFFHMEFTTYFFPASSEYEVPPDSTHMVVGPFEFLVDHRSIRWMVYVFENILNAFEAPQVVAADSEAFAPDFRAEFFMPKIILLAPSESLVDNRLPSRFLINFSTIRVSNFILLDDPAVLLPVLFRDIDNQSLEFVEKLESSLLNAGVHDQLEQLRQANHKDEGVFKPCSKHNQWFLSIPSFWLSCDFGKSRGGEIGLVNDVSLAGCIVQHSDHIAIMLEPQSPVGVTLDHFQFVQLLQVQTKMVALLDQIDLDRQFFAKNLTHLPEKTPLALFCLIHKVHVSLILPIGTVPSPYELKWSSKFPLPESATSTSLSSAGTALLSASANACNHLLEALYDAIYYIFLAALSFLHFKPMLLSLHTFQLNMMDRLLKKLQQAWLKWDILLKKWNKWMYEKDTFVDRFDNNMFWLRGWPFLWLHKLLIFRAQFKKIVNFRNIKWLDGVGDFHKDEVYSSDQLSNYYFNDWTPEFCLSPSGRFLFVLTRDEAYVTSELNSHASIQTCVIDLLLGEHYNVEINGLSEVSTNQPYYNFVGFYALNDSVVVYLDKFSERKTLRQRVVSINHRQHKAECVGHRVFRLNESRFALERWLSFDYGSDYCVISNVRGQILRFSKNPALASVFRDACATFVHDFSRDPVLFSAKASDDLFFPIRDDAFRLRKFAVADSLNNQNGWPSTAFHRYSLSSHELTMQSAAPCYKTGFPVFFRGNASSSQAVGKQRGSHMTPVEVTLYPTRSPALRTMLFASRLVTASTLCWAAMRWIFEPHLAFSFTLYFHLLLSYTLSSLRKELHKCVRKLFPSHTISSGVLDTIEWRWISTSDIRGFLSGKIISEASLEQVSYNCTWRSKSVSILYHPVVNNKCISLKRIVEMELQRFPNIALKEAELPTDESSLRLRLAEDLKISKHTSSTTPPLPINNGLSAYPLPESALQSTTTTIISREPSMGALTPVQEYHPSRKQVANFPDFPNTVMELETASNADAETMSVTTTTSDNEKQFMLLEASNIGDDDIFFNPDIEVAKDASLVDEQLQLCKRKKEFFNKEVNVFDIFLENTSVFLAANAKQPLSKDPADNITLGYTSKVQVGERFKKLCRDIYTEAGMYESPKAENPNRSIEQSSQLRFEVHSRPLQTSIKVDVSGIDVSLSDEIVSQLAPFIQNDTEDDSPPVLEICLQNCDIEIKDPKKKYPLRLRLGELKVKDGPESKF